MVSKARVPEAFRTVDAVLLLGTGFAIWPFATAVLHADIARSLGYLLYFGFVGWRLSATLLSLPADPKTAREVRGLRELGPRLDKALGERDELRIEEARLKMRLADSENALREFLKIMNEPPDKRGIRWVHGSVGRHLLSWHNETLQLALDRVARLSVEDLVRAIGDVDAARDARTGAQAVKALVARAVSGEEAPP